MKRIRINEILSFLDSLNCEYRFTGTGDEIIEDICSLQEPQSCSICWIKSEKFASDGIISQLRGLGGMVVVCPFAIEGVGCIITDYPKGVFFSIANNFFYSENPRSVSPSATVLTDNIGMNVNIGAGCYIGPDVIIGDDTYIHPNVSIICPCVIGKSCEIFPGVVIGADGGGYYFSDGIPYRERHFKGVRIGDNVDIGSNTCIDRGLLTDTRIGSNVKIDNLCHIAHNAVIEDNCLIIAGTIICGSAHIENSAYLAPASVVLNQIKVGRGSTVGVNSAAIMDVKKDTTVFGTPARKLSSKNETDK